MQGSQAKSLTKALAMLFLLAIFAPKFLLAVGTEEAWASPNQKTGNGNRKTRFLRSGYPTFPPSPKPNTRYHQIRPISPPPLIS